MLSAIITSTTENSPAPAAPHSVVGTTRCDRHAGALQQPSLHQTAARCACYSGSLPVHEQSYAAPRECETKLLPVPA